MRARRGRNLADSLLLTFYRNCYNFVLVGQGISKSFLKFAIILKSPVTQQLLRQL